MHLTAFVSYAKTITANWVKPDFMLMSPKYREIRKRCSSPMDTCYWCHHKMEDGEMIGLANLKGIGGNVVLCQKCAEELLMSKS
jgi:hypothetical protein